jgi:hypothetical protein
MHYDLGVKRELVCSERLRLLLEANTVLNGYGQLVSILRNVAGKGRHEIFAFAMRRARESSGRVTAAFEAYYDHLELHGCGGGQVPATVHLPGVAVVRPVPVTQ